MVITAVINVLARSVICVKGLQLCQDTCKLIGVDCVADNDQFGPQESAIITLSASVVAASIETI
jgi:hypothetical protein